MQYMAEQEQGHATLLTNILGAQAPRQCTYNYPVSNVREFLDFNQKLTRVGESGVYGFLPHLKQQTCGPVASPECRSRGSPAAHLPPAGWTIPHAGMACSCNSPELGMDSAGTVHLKLPWQPDTAYMAKLPFTIHPESAQSCSHQCFQCIQRDHWRLCQHSFYCKHHVLAALPQRDQCDAQLRASHQPEPQHSALLSRPPGLLELGSPRKASRAKQQLRDYKQSKNPQVGGLGIAAKRHVLSTAQHQPAKPDGVYLPA